MAVLYVCAAESDSLPFALGMKLSIGSMAAMVDYYLRSKNRPKARAMLELVSHKHRSTDKAQLVYMLAESLCSVEPPQFHGALRIVVQCQHLWDFNISQRHFNLIMFAANRQKDANFALRVACQMQEDDINLAPNIQSYEAIVEAHGINDDPRAAAQTLTKMKQKGIRVTQNILSITLNICLKHRDATRSQIVLDRMKEKSFHVSRDQFHKLMQCYSSPKSGGLNPKEAKPVSLTRAFATKTYMQRSQHQPTLETYHILLRGCLNARSIERAEKVLLMMSKEQKGRKKVAKRHRIVATVETYNLLIEIYAKAGDLKHAMLIFRKRMPEKGIIPNKYTYNILACECARAANWDDANDLSRIMRIKQVETFVETQMAIILLNVEVGKLDRAYWLYKEFTTGKIHSSLMDSFPDDADVNALRLSTSCNKPSIGLLRRFLSALVEALLSEISKNRWIVLLARTLEIVYAGDDATGQGGSDELVAFLERKEIHYRLAKRKKIFSRFYKDPDIATPLTELEHLLPTLAE